MAVLVGTILGLLAAFAVFSAFTWVWFVPLIMRVFAQPPWLPANILAPVGGAEECRFSTRDGLVLRGSYLPTLAATRQGVIVYCHEFAGDRWGALPYIERLRQHGFDIFTFDFRNHGASDCLPNYQPLHWLTQYELEDVLAAVDYVCSRRDAASHGIGLIGVSRGANAALCAAAMDGRVRAVVTDGAFPVGPMQRHYIRRFMSIYIRVPLLAEKLPDICLVSYCEWAKFLLGLRRRCRFINIEQVARRVHCPVFMIHGKRDGYIPLEVARDLRTRLAGRSKMWIVPGVKHNGAILLATEEYHRRTWRFFRKYLAGGRDLAWDEDRRECVYADAQPSGGENLGGHHANEFGIAPALDAPHREPT